MDELIGIDSLISSKSQKFIDEGDCFFRDVVFRGKGDMVDGDQGDQFRDGVLHVRADSVEHLVEDDT